VNTVTHLLSHLFINLCKMGFCFWKGK